MSGRSHRKIFLAAGLVNVLGVPFITRGFTNEFLARYDPEAFSNLGMALIFAWGVAYLGTSRLARVPALLVAAFVCEKAIYLGRWVWWLASDRPDFDVIFEADWMTGVYYATYGVIDGGLGVVFAYVLFRTLRTAPDPPAP